MKFENYIKISVLIFAITFLLNGCERKNEDFSGTYCINIQNMDMTIVQTGLNVTFTLQSDLLENGTGEVSDNTLILTATTSGSETFSSQVTFSGDRQSFSGPFKVTGLNDETMLEGILLGTKGECVKYDISANGIPRFAETDFTQLSKIEKISKFRSGFGHSFTDGNESCRSMKHYYNPYVDFRQNNNVEIYSPVNGTIISVLNDGHGASTGLTNKEIEIKPDDQPAFVYILYHCDLASSEISTGKKVRAGDLLGYARMYYVEEQHYVTSFDIAACVNTPSGMQLISWFETMKDDVFANYVSRGVTSRDNFIITREARDSDPLQCDGETFLTSGSIDNWVILN